MSVVVARPVAERTALKEWAVLVDALGRGEITLFVRKGGIREQRAGFQVRHDWFLLYPTFFHEKSIELADRFRGRLATEPDDGLTQRTVRIEYLCEVAAVWCVTDLALAHAVADEYGLAPAAVTSRFHYRGRPEVQVIAARAYRLAAPAVLPEVRRYRGCVSWVELDRDIDVSDATPVLDGRAFTRRMEALVLVLGPPSASGDPPRPSALG